MSDDKIIKLGSVYRRRTGHLCLIMVELAPSYIGYKFGIRWMDERFFLYTENGTTVNDSHRSMFDLIGEVSTADAIIDSDYQRLLRDARAVSIALDNLNPKVPENRSVVNKIRDYIKNLFGKI